MERRLGPAAAAVLAVCAGNALAQAARAVRDVTETDFVAFDAGARLLRWGSSCLYCLDEQLRAQTSLLGFSQGNVTFYTNPPLAALLLQPLSALPVQVALIIFEAASLAALAGCALVALRLLAASPASRAHRALLIGLAAVSLPGAQALAFGQWDVLLELAALLALLALVRGRPLAAGLLLSLLLLKPQLVWLAVPALLLGRSWRLLAGLGAGAAAWVASSLAVVGAGQLGEWVHQVLPRHAGEAHRTMGIPGAVAGLAGVEAGLAVTGVLLAAALVAGWRLRAALRGRAELALALGLAASQLLSPHIWPHDTPLLAVPLLVWARRDAAGALRAAAALNVAYLVDLPLPEAAAHARTLAVAWIVLGLFRLLRAEAGQAARSAASPAPAAGLGDRRAINGERSCARRCARPRTPTRRGIL